MKISFEYGHDFEKRITILPATFLGLMVPALLVRYYRRDFRRSKNGT
ncbi:hypothetical protein SAMN05443144_102144 [Fodinibius roseus]|uniref:Uncharacterized protein n=1 Tax=Fodinibius roseus TaxID=1194090 RepID=A0A1M4UX07_9BACT|nr:hypothetical protein [Fodinibius roseus]SHE61170.1 hypothetical protein SAMN05443144_102144 [Fodinibius roseus]